MSMTLKKGQKAFKPKFAARRPGGSTPTSARPSVERQSQTPVPPPRPSEPIVIPDHDDGNELLLETTVVQSTSQPQTLESPASSTQQQTTHPERLRNASLTDNIPKRKTEIESGPGSLQKRAKLDASQPPRDVDIAQREVASGDTRNTITDGVPILDIGLSQSQQVLQQSGTQSQKSLGIPSSQPQASQVEVSPPTSKDASHSVVPDLISAVRIPADAGPTSMRAGTGSWVNEKSDAPPAGNSATTLDMREITDVVENTTSRQTTPEVRQDNPSSVYPDPELSEVPWARTAGGIPSSGMMMGTASDIDETTLGQTVNLAGLNPDGTPASDMVPAVALNPDGTSRVDQGLFAKAKKKAPTKRRRVLLPEGDDVRPTIEMRLNRVRHIEGGSKRQRKKKDENKKRKKRGETPEGAEDEIIDRAAMTMADLCKDLKIGEKSSRHEQMKKQMKAAKLKAKKVRLAKKRAAERAAHGEGPESAVDLEGEEEHSQWGAAPASPETEEARAGGIRYMLVDGNVVLDPRSVEMRQGESSTRKGGKKDWAADIKEIRQENEFSTIVTSGSYMKREPAQNWSYADTELFYKALSMFGPNFEMMAKMFPSRNRRQIKLKHATEERDNLWRIEKVEKGPKIPIDWNLFQEHCNEKMVDVEEIEAELQEHADAEARVEEAMLKERLAADEQKRATIRKSGNEGARRALGNISDDDGGDGNEKSQSALREASAAPKGKRKAAPSKRMKKNMGRQDPDNYTVVARID